MFHIWFFLLPLAATQVLALAFQSNEVEVLMHVKNSLNSSSALLADWSQAAKTPCRWTGVVCDKASQTVVGLNLSNMNFSGQFPPQVCNLANLKLLTLRNNFMRGELPRILGSCRRLQVLDLSKNQMTGQIPQELFVKSLVHLDLSHNQVIGHIPATIGRATQLQYLSMAANMLTGSIPAEIVQLSKLMVLSLWKNNLTGELPKNLDRLPQLEGIYLGGNKLSGEIPKEIGRLPKLKQLSLIFNQFNGSLPEELGLHSPLLSVSVGFNYRLTGPIPANICNNHMLELLSLSFNRMSGDLTPIDNCSSLSIVSVNRNLFHGPLPSRLLGSTTLQQFYGLDNFLDGSIPSSIQNATALSIFHMNNNSLDGMLPPSIAHLPNLAIFKVRNNLLTGQLPTGPFTSLQLLDVAQNRLSGNIAQLGEKLVTLDLSRNSFSGSFPSQICTMPKLKILIVAFNQLSGTLPFCLGNMPSLHILDLSYNSLNGEVPATIQQLQAYKGGPPKTEEGTYPNPVYVQPTSLLNQFVAVYGEEIFEGNWRHAFRAEAVPQSMNTYLITICWKGQYQQIPQVFPSTTSFDLSHNKLTGNIPPEFGELVGLRNFNLSFNGFTGELPPQLSHITSLESLDLSSNSIQGPIPTDLTRLGFLSRLNVSHNNLTGRIPSYNGFDTRFDVSSFAGNLGLCGQPLGACQANPGTYVTHQSWFRDSLEGMIIGAAVSFLPSFYMALSYRK